MISINKTRLFGLLAMAALSIQSGTSLAESGKPAAKDAGLDQLDCRTLLRLGGDERAYTLLYLHGFVSGKLGQLQLDVQTMADVTDRVVEHCIDHPSDRLLPVFQKQRMAR